MKKLVISLIFLGVFLSANFIFSELEDGLGYRINPKDILEITVYEEPDLSKNFMVNLDGEIVYPLLGNIVVRGLTTEDVERKIAELLAKDYLVDPQVSVLIKESVKISILGKVNKPGTYELKSSMTVLDAIISAGGFSIDANAKEVKIVRMKGEGKETINVDVDTIIKDSDRKSDISLEPGDLVLAGGLSQSSSQIILFGEVKRPGSYAYTTGMDIIEAIALAGGLTDIAAADSTKIIREKDGKRLTIKIPLGSILKGGNQNQDISIEPNDTIVVPQSFF